MSYGIQYWLPTMQPDYPDVIPGWNWAICSPLGSKVPIPYTRDRAINRAMALRSCWTTQDWGHLQLRIREIQ